MGAKMSAMKDPVLSVPKQFWHWAEAFKFRPWGWKRRRFRKLAFQLRHPSGRRMRINCHGELQLCDGDFDRWANSVGASAPLPQTQAAFRSAMARMLTSHPGANGAQP